MRQSRVEIEMFVLLAALAFASAVTTPSPATPRVRLTIHVIQRCPPAASCLPMRIVTRVKHETERIWSPLDVRIAWADSSEAEPPAPSAGMTVLLEENADAPWPPEQGFALAALHRPDDPCGWAVAHVWVRRVRAHAASVHVAGQPFINLPGVLAETILVRALARALAHEIGHYVLGTATHSAHGLMRAHIVPQELLEDPIQSLFGLSSRERASLISCGQKSETDLSPSADCATSTGCRE